MKKIILTAIAALSLTAVSCKNEVPPPALLNQNVAVILRSPTDTIGLQIAKGIIAASMQYGIVAEIFTADSLTDYATQIDLLENLNVDELFGVIIVPASTTKLDATIAKVGQFVPIVVAQIPISPTTSILTFVGTDNIKAGITMAASVNSLLAPTDTVNIIEIESSPLTSARIFGFSERISELGHEILVNVYPNYDDLQYYIELLVEKSESQIKVIVTGDPESAMIVAATLKSIDRTDIKVFTFEIPQSIANGIKTGTITGTMAPNTYQIGYNSIISIINAFEFQTPEHTQYLPSMYISSGNILSPEAQIYVNSI